MRLIDADAFEAVLNERLLPILIERYGRDEALRGLHFSFRDCICNIQSQPTIEPEPRWIPCDERMPEADGVYIVTDYFLGDSPRVDWNIFINGGWLYCNKNPIAWMPLPEPYEEVDDDNSE